ncbi:unnamed protein product [Camellia sinensis]
MSKLINVGLSFMCQLNLHGINGGVLDQVELWSALDEGRKGRCWGGERVADWLVMVHSDNANGVSNKRVRDTQEDGGFGVGLRFGKEFIG